MKEEENSLRYPIGKEEQQKEFESGFSLELKSSLIEDVKMLPSCLELSIQNLDEAQLQTAYRPGGWTVHQLVHHIADSHINAYTRFKLGFTEDNPLIKPYNQESWVTLPDVEILPVNISITLLHALHVRWCTFMDNLPERDWQRTVWHPERNVELSLWRLLKSYSWHCRHHVAQINALRRRMKWND